MVNSDDDLFIHAANGEWELVRDKEEEIMISKKADKKTQRGIQSEEMIPRATVAISRTGKKINKLILSSSEVKTPTTLKKTKSVKQRSKNQDEPEETKQRKTGAIPKSNRNARKLVLSGTADSSEDEIPSTLKKTMSVMQGSKIQEKPDETKQRNTGAIPKSTRNARKLILSVTVDSSEDEILIVSKSIKQAKPKKKPVMVICDKQLRTVGGSGVLAAVSC